MNIFVGGHSYAEYTTSRKVLTMILDCQSCVMRDVACDDCVVTALLGPMSINLEQDRPMLDSLAQAGLVPPLRLIRGQGQTSDTETSAAG